MQKKNVTCPNCGASLEVSNPESKEIKVVPCPKCGLKLGIKFDKGQTVIASVNSNKKEIGYLMCGGECYELKVGINTIGRKSAKSASTVQIATDDMSVSRVHAEIEVVKLENENIKAILRDVRDEEKANLKPMYFGDDRMYPEDRLDLENGDTFKIGETIVKYLQ